ncbi:MAG: hypothetical protein SPI12_01830 [Actinomycetaceae bacterium]|nr:hypothetical protein [Actinomycetaceae bacterium]MDY6082588.1 hypothetical protein [Actinomycetaceae bacterium]
MSNNNDNDASTLQDDVDQDINLILGGRKFMFSPLVFDDWELLEDLAGLDKMTDPSGIISVAHRVFGHQYEDAKEAIRDEDGRVRASTMSAAIRHVFEAFPKSDSSQDASPSIQTN